MHYAPLCIIIRFKFIPRGLGPRGYKYPLGPRPREPTSDEDSKGEPFPLAENPFNPLIMK